MKQKLLRLVVASGLATAVLGIVQAVAYADGEGLPGRIGSNHNEPQR